MYTFEEMKALLDRSDLYAEMAAAEAAQKAAKNDLNL